MEQRREPLPDVTEEVAEYMDTNEAIHNLDTLRTLHSDLPNECVMKFDEDVVTILLLNSDYSQILGKLIIYKDLSLRNFCTSIDL